MVLSCRNSDITKLNLEALQIFHGHVHKYVSNDSVILEQCVDMGNIYPIEYLNSLTPRGLPLAKLKLKVEAPIMLLWNLSP